LIKKSYDINALKNYIDDVLCPELVEKGKFVYKKLKVRGAEGDDVIACLVNNFENDYVEKVLLASDHDFLQLGDKVRQFDLTGKEIQERIKVKKEEIILDAKTALKVKILSGDNSDNIPAIMERVGKVKAYKLATNENVLKKLLLENQDAAKQYALNEKIIDFSKIPKELEEKIVETARPILKKEDNERSLNDKMMDSVFVIE
jgi:5'-3' exonuclease